MTSNVASGVTGQEPPDGGADERATLDDDAADAPSSFADGLVANIGERVLVTGACGFMGGRLCAALRESDVAVRGTDLASAHDGSYTGSDVEFVPADLTDPASLDGLLADVDTVFHTAALFSYASNAPWEQFEAINVEGTRHLCDLARDANVRKFVHWSTAGVYGAPQRDRLPVTEDHPKDPESNYDRSKWLQEQVVEEYHEEYGLPAVAMRLVPVYGPGNTYGAAQLWAAVAKGYLQVFPAFCDYRLPLVHLEDVLRASVHLSDAGEPGEAYNVVDDQDYRMKEVLDFVAELTDAHVYELPLGWRTYEALDLVRSLVPWIERRYRAAGKQPPFERDALFYAKGNYWIDNGKLRSTGFVPAYPRYERGLAETIKWCREEGIV